MNRVQAFDFTRAKSLLRTIIRSAIWNAQSLAVSANKYIPYEPNRDSYVISKVQSKVDEQNFTIPPKSLRFGYDEIEEFLVFGQRDTSKMLDILAESDFQLTKGKHVLDLGCGPGRMIRHLSQYSEDCEIWGLDIDARVIHWCRNNLLPFNFATSTTIPHLPFEDHYFDLVYTGSVLTHIDDLAESWLLEIRRVLKPSGRFYATIHDKNTIEVLNTTMREHELSERLRTFDLYNRFQDNFNMLVLGRDTVSQVFYDIDYFCKVVSPIYDVISTHEEAYGYQTAILLCRKS